MFYQWIFQTTILHYLGIILALPGLGYSTLPVSPSLTPPPPLPLYAQDNKRIMGACLYRAHVSSFLLLHFLLVIFIISLFFIEIFCLTCTPRHLALHRSWLHVLVLFGRSVFFPLSFMYRCYTAMISQALSRFHSCMSHTSNSLYFVSASASILQLANTLPITTFSRILVPR